jgi:hypothetical protein
MKKLTAAVIAVLCNFVSFGMENAADVFEKLDRHIHKWSAKLIAPVKERWNPNGEKFTTAPFKDKLLAEIGEDPAAREAFKLFHEHNFPKCWEYQRDHNHEMSPDNSEKFKDLLMLAAPVIDLTDGTESCVREIILTSDKPDIIEKIRDVLSRVSEFPRFSWEMFFCLTADTKWGSETCNSLLSQAGKEICRSIADRSCWPLKEEEEKLLRITGQCEGALDFYGEGDDAKLWYARRPEPRDESCRRISQRLFGDNAS